MGKELTCRFYSICSFICLFLLVSRASPRCLRLKKVYVGAGKARNDANVEVRAQLLGVSFLLSLHGTQVVRLGGHLLYPLSILSCLRHFLPCSTG